jgi:hypothetical protein
MKMKFAGPIVAVALLGGSASGALAAPPGEAMMTCTNPASGASWQIKIDYDKGTVDSNPAKIGTSEISWSDTSGNYTLDRGTGKLTVVVASSTGGYFLYDQCQAKP